MEKPLPPFVELQEQQRLDMQEMRLREISKAADVMRTVSSHYAELIGAKYNDDTKADEIIRRLLDADPS